MSRIQDALDGILEQGYAVVPMPETMRTLFAGIPESLAAVTQAQKAAFSFPDRLDGFLPFGQEHAENNPDHPDLCERFCYFRKNRDDHASNSFAQTPFYIGVAEYEAAVTSFADSVLGALFERLGGPAPIAPGRDSYIQMCRYGAEYAMMGAHREFLMDPHIDGQLLTFVAQTDHGLMVGSDSAHMKPVVFGSDDIFIMAGKLLELATDGEIKGILHAVRQGEWARPRMSLIYFQNPCFDGQVYSSLREGRKIDFYAVANDIHRSYGNPSYRE